MNKSIDHLNFISHHIDKTLKYISQKNLTYVEILLYNLAERLRNTSSSLILLLQNYEVNNVHEFSIGILIRPLMADTLIGLYIYQQLEENEKLGEGKLTEEAFRLRINIIAEAFLSDGFSKTIEYAELQESKELMSKEKLQIFYNQFVKDHEDFFEKYAFDGTKPKIKAYTGIKTSTTALYKSITQSETLRKFSRIYDTWVYYSKYEHQSITTLKLLRNLEGHKERISISIQDLGMHSYFIHRFLAASFREDDFLINQTELIMTYVLPS